MKINIPVVGEIDFQPLRWFVMLLGFSAAAQGLRKNDFPDSGSFVEQKNYIDGLPPVCTQKKYGEVYTTLVSFRDAENPFSVESKEVPDDVEVHVWKHQFFDDKGIATRRSKMINKKENENSKTHPQEEETEILIQSKGGNDPTLFRFKTSKEGDWIPISEEKKTIDEFREKLGEDNKAHVIEVSSEKKGTCFTYK